jgi:TolB protein
VVYASDRDGSVDLYLMDIGKGDKRRLTANGLRNEMPSWSPSGTMIAWMAADAQGAAALHVMKADGSGQTKLLGGVQAGGRPPWAPESDALAAVLRQDGEWALHVIRPDGTRLRRLTGDHSPIGSPAWSR